MMSRASAAPLPSPPDPERVDGLVEALRRFAEVLRPSPPDQAEASERADRLSSAIEALGPVRAWRDAPGEMTGLGVVASYVDSVSGVLAGIMARSGAAQVDGHWSPPADATVFAFPSEVRSLDGSAVGLAEASGAIRRLGAGGSMNPMDSPEPIRVPDLDELATLVEVAGHWLRTCRLREGEEPLDEDRPAIAQACCYLRASFWRFKLDIRWIACPDYRRLRRAFDVVAGKLHEVMARGCLAWTGDGIEYRPPDPVIVDGIVRIPPTPLYLSPAEAQEVERAWRDLGDELARFRAEAARVQPEEPAREPGPKPPHDLKPILGSQASILVALDLAPTYTLGLETRRKNGELIYKKLSTARNSKIRLWMTDPTEHRRVQAAIEKITGKKIVRDKPKSRK